MRQIELFRKMNKGTEIHVKRLNAIRQHTFQTQQLFNHEKLTKERDAEAHNQGRNHQCSSDEDRVHMRFANV